jgi:ribosome biogenesis protein MAK21
MPKPIKKGKGPRRSNDGRRFDDSALNNLTAKIDHNLGSNDHKRKQPPTKTAGDQHQKRQRNSQGTSENKDGKLDNDALLEEIKALGGDESDLALIKDIDSEDEMSAKDSKASVDKKLKNELAALSKELGFAEIEMSEASDQDEGAEEESEDGEEEDDDEDESEEEVKTEVKKEVKQVPKSQDPTLPKVKGLVCQPKLLKASLTANAVM